MYNKDDCRADVSINYPLPIIHRGSHFLKKWMEFLEGEADLRYPDVTSIGSDYM